MNKEHRISKRYIFVIFLSFLFPSYSYSQESSSSVTQYEKYLDITTQSTAVVAGATADLAHSIQIFIACFIGLTALGGVAGALFIPWLTAKNVSHTKREILEEVTNSLRDTTGEVVRRASLDVSNEFTDTLVLLEKVNNKLASASNGKLANSVVDLSARQIQIVEWIHKTYTEGSFSGEDASVAIAELETSVIDIKELYSLASIEVQIPLILYTLMHPQNMDISKHVDVLESLIGSLEHDSAGAVSAYLIHICNSQIFGPNDILSNERLRRIANKYILVPNSKHDAFDSF